MSYGHSNCMPERLGKYVPTTVYNDTKILSMMTGIEKTYETNKNEATPSITNHEVTDQFVFCETCLIEL